MASSVDLADRPIALQGIASVQPAGYSAIELRRLASTELDQEGVVGAGDFKVTPGAAAKTLSVAAGEAGIDGDSTSNQGRYYQRNSAAQTLDLAIAPDATNPRIDQLVLEVKDDNHDASGLNVGRLRVVSGTASAGATLANRSGAAALPSTCIRLADILVPANYNAAFVQNTHIRDRRPWARGACVVIRRQANAAAGSDYTTTSLNTLVAIDSTNLSPRVECSGAPLRVSMVGSWKNASVTDNFWHLALDGTLQDGVSASNPGVYIGSEHGLGSGWLSFSPQWHGTPAAGSHTVAPYWAVGGGTGTLRASPQSPLFMLVEEILRPSAENTGA